MKKKVFIIIIIVVTCFICVIGGLGIYKYFTIDGAPLIKNKNAVSLMSFDKFKDIDIDTIESVTIVKYTEAGNDEEIITDKKEIKSLYDRLSNIKVGKEVNMSCEDNTTIYNFNRKDGKDIPIEIECDWLVINEKRYLIK